MTQSYLRLVTELNHTKVHYITLSCTEIILTTDYMQFRHQNQ